VDRDVDMLAPFGEVKRKLLPDEAFSATASYAR